LEGNGEKERGRKGKGENGEGLREGRKGKEKGEKFSA